MKRIFSKIFEDSELKATEQISGGASGGGDGDCSDYTEQIDYTNDCEVDDECWVCDDRVIKIYPH